MKARAKNTIQLLLKILLAVALIAYMIHSGHLDLSQLWSLLTPINMALALFFIGLNVFLSAWRWVLLLHARGMKISLKYGYGLYLIGTFFNHALPGSVGGDLVRGYYLVADYPDRKLDSILSVFIDRVLGLYSFFVLTLIAVFFDFDFINSHDHIRVIAAISVAVFLGLTILFMIGFSQRLSQLTGLTWLAGRVGAIHKLLSAFLRFGQYRKAIALSVLVSIAAQLSTMFFFYHLAIASGETAISWNAILFAVPMGFVVTAIPISPAGVGVGQVAFQYLFQIYLNKPTTFGATAITAFQLGVACWGLVGAVLYLRRGKPAELRELSETAMS